MTSPLVTVYILNHNYGDFLKQAVDSVLNQSQKNIEIILIDDGSKDNSNSLLSYYDSIPEINVVRQKNRGLTYSNNIALKMSKAKYILRLDADDYFHPNAIETMTNLLESRKDVALVFPDYYEVDEEGKILKRIKRHNFEKKVKLFDIPAHGACTMVRKSILNEIGGYDEEFSRQDGYYIWLNIIEKYKVLNVNRPLFYYRKHSKNLTKNETFLYKVRGDILNKHLNKKNYKHLKVLAIIPVRGSDIDNNSLPLKQLGNKKLISWTIDSVLENKLVNDVIVSSSDEIVNKFLEKKYENKLKIHKRPRSFSRINSDIAQTIKLIIDNLSMKEKPDVIVILNIESPFRSSMYISKAINTIKFFNVDAVIGVREDDDLFYFHDGKGLKPRLKSNKLRLERNNLFRKVGGINVVKRSYFEKENKIVGGKIGHILMDQKSAFVLKSDIDWIIAKSLMKN